MENILISINSAVQAENRQEIIKNLKLLLDQADSFKLKDECIFKTLLNYCDVNIQTATVEVIAEYSKVEDNRKLFTDNEIVQKLVQLLDKGNELGFATVRALANICYENEEACTFVDETGFNKILSLLKRDLEHGDDFLTTKVCGLLVNLLHTRDSFCQKSLKNGILDIIEKLLLKYKDKLEKNKLLITFLLSVLNSLTDHVDDVEHIFTDKLTEIVVDIFKQSEISEICVLCLEIFYTLSEKDEVKRILARHGICDVLYNLIEKYRDEMNDEESRSILKMACDVIVLILTEDYCMNLLYNNGEGQTYKNMLTWLDSDDPDLLSTSILALGNFARKDTHCIQIVNQGVSKRLISLLKQYNKSMDIKDVNVQHALLSTLKNLVIPKENKKQVLDEGIIEVMYPMLKQDHYLVVFKFLGTFRMIVDGQKEAALNLISRQDFIERLTYWCYNSDHLGVRGEVPRIFSWLIKNCHSSEAFPMFVSVKDSVRCIVEMIASNHAVMQNEAFLALALLSTGLLDNQKTKYLDQFYDSLVSASLGAKLNFITTKYGNKWNEDTIENLLNLLDHLIVSDKVVTNLKDANYTDALYKLKDNPNNKNTKKLDKIISELKNK